MGLVRAAFHWQAAIATPMLHKCIDVLHSVFVSCRQHMLFIYSIYTSFHIVLWCGRSTNYVAASQTRTWKTACKEKM